MGLSIVTIGVALLLATGVAIAATINGGNGDDNIEGTEGPDTIYGN